MLSVNTNIAALTAQQNLAGSQDKLNISLQRLSSGLRINSSADDPAGLQISDGFTSQINGINQASQNANDAIALAQTADGALTQITNNLQTIRQLAVEAANGSNSASDRQALDQQVQQDIAEISRVATQTSFNNQNILDGSFGTAQFQVGADVGQTISIALNQSVSANSIGAFVSTASNVANTPTGKTVSYGVSGTALTSGAGEEINGTALLASAGFAGPSATYQGATSAYAIAAAINASGVSGVSASATNVLNLSNDAGTGNFATTAAGKVTNLSINGVQVYSNTATAAGTITNQQIADAINASASSTGVTAAVAGAANASAFPPVAAGDLILTAADGRDIAISTTGTTATLANTKTDATYQGQVTLNSTSTLSLDSTTQGILGFSSASPAASGTLAAQNVQTIAGANATILAVDSAISTVDQLAATFGSIQNRFQSAIASLGTAATNLTAARSTVLDANFASETSNLTRAQILQQAGVSILAQANALPQGVLKLLQ